MDFEKAAERVKNLNTPPTDEEKLELYGLFKQSTIGDVNIERPTGWFDMVGKAKWDAWKSQKGFTKDEAKVQYIIFVKKLLEKYGEQ